MRHECITSSSRYAYTGWCGRIQDDWWGLKIFGSSTCFLKCVAVFLAEEGVFDNATSTHILFSPMHVS